MPKDEVQALYWWRKAADQGNAAGQDGAAVYATSLNPELRNPALALQYALKAIAAKNNEPAYLDTLAEAYYVNGQYQNAIDEELKAIALSRTTHREEYTKNLTKYRAALAKR